MGFANKGRLAPGYDADVVVFDPNLRKQLSSGNLHSSIDWSAYADIECMGWTRDVIARGEIIVQSSRLQATAGWGQYVKRSL
jgi:dihydropyrimidinase